jgi:hypothetical protein
MQKVVNNDQIWTEESFNTDLFPQKYRIHHMWSANTDLLKNLLTNPKRAMEFPFWVFLTLFISTLTIFSIVHSLLVMLTANFVSYEVKTFLTGMIRIFGSTIVAIFIATPGVVMMWVITPQISFTSAFKRFLFYYETVILFSLLGELFFSKFIIDSSMKLQPFVIIFAGSIAVNTLHRALENEPNIQITRLFIVGILCFSYIQAFLIIDELIPYYLQDNIDSPITIYIKQFFQTIFG